METTCSGKKCAPAMVGYYLVLVGALNWGLVGIGGFIHYDLNIVHRIFGSISMLESVVYVLVGVAGVMTAIGCKCATCNAGKCAMDHSADDVKK